jgi:predicted Fe-Mo cluster-binding NifX family protein
MLDPRFGRAPYLIIYDTETADLEVIDNSASSALAHGAGIQTAQSVINKRVDVVVSGNFGPKASQVLQAANIKLLTSPEVTIAETLEKIERNELQPFA